jgi:hypothetical protein
MIISLLLLSFGCSNGEKSSASSNEKPVQKTENIVKIEPPRPKMEPLLGGPYPGLLLTQAWFWKDGSGNMQPGPARLDIWRLNESKWERTRLEDADSNVFHKAVPYDGGILTIGAEKANLKYWRFVDGKWNTELLWSKEWGGKFNRLRDIEIGDVDGDGLDEWVIATHDSGVVAVIDPAKGDTPLKVTELDKKSDTFVHEIEIGDINGDGKKEFFVTPSDRNQSKKSQPGKVVMYRWDGSKYISKIVDEYQKTHAKEILVADIDGKKGDELISVVEAERVGKVIIKPVEIRLLIEGKDGFSVQKITSLGMEEEQCRFLVPGDFDLDGQVELVAAGYKSGLWLIDPQPDGTWKNILIDADSSGFEHASFGADLDKNNKLELYVAADKQGSFNRYMWNSESNKFNKEKIGDIAQNTFTWNIVSGEF